MLRRPQMFGFGVGAGRVAAGDKGYGEVMTVHDPLGPQPDPMEPEPMPGGPPEPVTPILPDPTLAPHDPDPVPEPEPIEH